MADRDGNLQRQLLELVEKIEETSKETQRIQNDLEKSIVQTEDAKRKLVEGISRFRIYLDEAIRRWSRAENT